MAINRILELSQKESQKNPSSQEKQFLIKSCKILAINTTFTKFIQKIHLAKFLQQYCNTLSFPAKILEDSCFLQKNTFL